MSTPGYPGNSSDQPDQAGPGKPGDPFAAGPQGHPGQGGSGYPSAPGGYPGQSGYPSAPGGYPAQQGGYPGQQGGYPGQQGGYPGQQGYPPQGGYPAQGGYPGPQQGYGGYPGQYPGGVAQGTPPVRPITVTAAFWCWIGTTVVSLISLIVTLNSSVWDQALQAGVRQSGDTTIDVQALVNGVRIFAIVVFLIFAAVYLLFAFKMHAGRNWARIVLTVFGALSLLSAITPTTSSVTVNGETYSSMSSGASSIVPWISALIAIAGIVLMYLPQSNEYFKQSKAFRQYPR